MLTARAIVLGISVDIDKELTKRNILRPDECVVKAARMCLKMFADFSEGCI